MALTTNQENWLKRVKEAEESDRSLSDYAKQHQIPVGSLYSWKSYFKKHGLLGDTPSAFVVVRLSEKRAQMRATSANRMLKNDGYQQTPLF